MSNMRNLCHAWMRFYGYYALLGPFPPRPVCLWHSAGPATVKLPRPLHLTYEIKTTGQAVTLDLLIYCVIVQLFNCDGFTAKGAHVRIAIRLLCNVVLDVND